MTNGMRTRTIAAVLGTVAVAVAGIAGCGGQAATDSSGTAAASGGTQQAQPPAGAPAGQDQMTAALAQELGISEAKVQAALENVMQDMGPGGTPPSAAPADSSGSSSRSSESAQSS